ncbi:MAG: septum formation protein Maf [Proteobacteria bacterium]|nr:septum formation protein Maf [Pseudomonadota bacterium]
MFKTLQPLILASSSPRRQEFLVNLGLDFEIKTAEVEENLRPDESAQDFVQRLALDKAWAISINHQDSWVLGADTVVVKDDHIMGKPVDEVEARLMLRGLSGRSHEVWTGFAVCRASDDCKVVDSVKTIVKFASFFPEQLLDAYVRTGEPLDKAGAYGIQGLGGLLVESIDGSYSNVVGLPVAEVIREFLRLGIVVPA